MQIADGLHHDLRRKKFIEMELAKRLGKRTAEEELDEGELRRRKVEQDLYHIPEHLQVGDIGYEGNPSACYTENMRSCI